MQKSSLAIFLILIGIIFSSGSVLGENPSVSSQKSVGDLIQFVKNASDYADKNTIPSALVTYQNLSGPFVTGNSYIFAYDFNGTLLAHPFLTGEVGKNRMNWTTTDGLRLIESSSDMGKNGSGFIFYTYPEPTGDTQVDEKSGKYLPKLSYITPLSDSVWIGSGVYFKDLVDPKTNVSMSEELESFVRDAVTYAKTEGKDKAIKTFNDPKGNFSRDSRYIYALDTNGTLLAQPDSEDLIGQNLMNITRADGVKSVKIATERAKEGGGYVAYSIVNPVSKKIESKLGYVLPVSDSWYVGSGLYASEISDQADPVLPYTGSNS